MPFDAENDHFAKTGSGQTQGQHSQERERCVSLQHSRYKAREDEALPLRYLEVSRIVKHSEAGQVRQRGTFFSVFIDENDRFAKTGSGQTQGKLEQEWRFLAVRARGQAADR
eukprot:COSAG06_NODE_7497_length_2483_cov_2.635067_3_plen_112_part_00